MSKTKPSPDTPEHNRTDRMKTLAAMTLGRNIGYLKAESLPGVGIFDDLQTRTYSANRPIRLKDELALIRQGTIEIRHAGYNKLARTLSAGTLFGEMALLGQSLFGTKVVSGPQGVTFTVMNAEQAQEWVEQQKFALLELIGARLIRVEAELYRSRFQFADSRIATLLLELAGTGTTVSGPTQGELGQMIGIYRETVTNTLGAMKADGLIEVGRRTITLLDKKRLRELSER